MDRKYTDFGRPDGSAISTMACLYVKRLKRIHSCLFYGILKNLLKPFFLGKNLLKTFFQYKNLLEKPFFRVSVAGRPGYGYWHGFASGEHPF